MKKGRNEHGGGEARRWVSAEQRVCTDEYGKRKLKYGHGPKQSLKNKASILYCKQK